MFLGRSFSLQTVNFVYLNIFILILHLKHIYYFRLSCFAGDTLTKGNPAITDLSDPNRPMKIGERYGELYDNDWTDAMEKVETIKQNFPDKDDSEIEEIMIKYLHRILKVSVFSGIII